MVFQNTSVDKSFPVQDCVAATHSNAAQQCSDNYLDIRNLLSKSKRYVTIIEKQLPYKKLSSDTLIKSQDALMEVNKILQSIINSHQ